MCRKYIFEKYTSNAIRAIGIRAIGFRAIGKRPFLQFGESEIRGIHPLRFEEPRCTLPDLLDDDETVDSGGVGFARKFIQLFCQRVGIKNYLQMDDNIRGLVAFEESSVSGQIITSHEPTEVGLSKILRTFDSLSKSRSTKLFWPVAFEPHGANPDKSLVESFTGPWQDFGVLGVRKYRHHNFKVFQNSYSRFLFDFCRLF